ncbi:hypothetical protein CCHOA_01075 [Corynebacterium choanae]|uniref:Uncharacterized protein n=1 Tax=Corynebacterium choanae TaxID=1862358 RepID=A0A3G6J4J0_9CORY|nr:hypothetical protein CCHOA_01075 [Corynebacterium choanae]
MGCAIASLIMVASGAFDDTLTFFALRGVVQQPEAAQCGRDIAFPCGIARDSRRFQSQDSGLP